MSTILLFLLMIKHAIADLALQHRHYNKGDKGSLKDSRNYLHALDHAVLTGLVVLVLVGLPTAIVLSLLDFVLHFVIDYAKTTYINRKKLTMKSQKFWTLQSIDQIAHMVCYLFYVIVAL